MKTFTDLRPDGKFYLWVDTEQPRHLLYHSEEWYFKYSLSHNFDDPDQQWRIDLEQWEQSCKQARENAVEADNSYAVENAIFLTHRISKRFIEKEHPYELHDYSLKIEERETSPMGSTSYPSFQKLGILTPTDKQ
jgi:hypothetical protein